MKKIRFLSLTDVLFLHQRQIEAYGGSRGIRNRGLLESALAIPLASFGGVFLHDSVPEMAGAYFYHLVMNHAFIDGNKRIGAMAADVFLDLNGYNLTADQDDMEKLAWDTAQGKVDKAHAAIFFKNHSEKVSR